MVVLKEKWGYCQLWKHVRHECISKVIHSLIKSVNLVLAPFNTAFILWGLWMSVLNFIPVQHLSIMYLACRFKVKDQTHKDSSSGSMNWPCRVFQIAWQSLVLFLRHFSNNWKGYLRIYSLIRLEDQEVQNIGPCLCTYRDIFKDKTGKT